MRTAVTVDTNQNDSFRWVRELYAFRNLIYFFTWRYLKVRYKQTALGVFWIAIQPLFLTAVVSLFIFRGLRVDFNLPNVTMILPVYFGMVLWSYFDKTVNTMTESLRSNRGIMAKIYFPKLIPPLASLVSGAVDLVFGLTLGLFIVLVTGSAIAFGGLPLVVIGILLMFVATAGAGLLFAALTVQYRDIAQILPFFFRIGIFITPVIYPVRFLPESVTNYLFINPMSGVIELVRYGLFDPSQIHWLGVGISAIVSVVLLIVGLIVFRKKEDTMIDVI
jgi:lipopolysaccharide transport system permease protein